MNLNHRDRIAALNAIAVHAQEIISRIRCIRDISAQFNLDIPLPPEKPLLEIIARCGQLKHQPGGNAT